MPLNKSSKVHILFTGLSSIGGIQRYNKSFIQSLKVLGFLPKILSLVDSVSIEGAEVFNHNRFSFLKAVISLRKEKPSFTFIGHVNLLPALFLLRKNQQIILIIHGIEVWKPLKKIEKLALKRVDKVFSVSQLTRSEFKRFNPFFSKPISIVPNQLSPDFLISTENEIVTRHQSEVFNILTVTRLVKGDKRGKHVFSIVEALDILLKTGIDIKWNLVCSGDDVQSHVEWISSFPEVLAVTTVFERPDDITLSNLYSNSQWFILPSEKEGFGIVFLEAMARGCVCIGGKAGGTPEVIEDNSSGFLVDFNSETPIHTQIARIILNLSKPEERIKYALAARKSLIRFSHETVNQVIRTELEELKSSK